MWKSTKRTQVPDDREERASIDSERELSSLNSSFRNVRLIEDLFPRKVVTLPGEIRPTVQPKDDITSSRPHDTQLFINMHPVQDLGPTVDDSDASLLPLIKYTEGNSFDLRGISNFLSSNPELDPKLQCAALQLLEHAAEWQNPNFTDNISVTFGPVAKLLLDSQDDLVHYAALDTLKLFLVSPRATDIVNSTILRRIVDVVSNDLNSLDILVQLASVELLSAATCSEEIFAEFSAAVSLISITLPSMPTTTQVPALRVLELSAGSRVYELIKAVTETFHYLCHPLSSPEPTVQTAVLQVLEAAVRTNDPMLARVVKPFLAAVEDVQSFSEIDVRSAARNVLEAAAHNDQLTDTLETISLDGIQTQALQLMDKGSDKGVDPIDDVSERFHGTIGLFKAIEWFFRPNINPGLRQALQSFVNDEAWSLRVCDLTGQLFCVQVGSGGFGDDRVKKCDWIKDGIAVKVAAKTRQQGESNELVFIEALKRELKVWIGLRHEHVVRLFGVAKLLGTTVMVCPWLENGTVTDFIASRRDLSTSDRVQLISDVAAGLRYLHSQSIVHGRLAGSNILVSAQGRAQLSDFSNSIILTDYSMNPNFTVGDVRWAAPEHLFATDNNMQALYTLQSDMYSFGSIMFHILSGVIPYHEVKRTRIVILKIVQGETPSRPEEPPISDRHWAFIQRCWSSFEQRSFRPSADEAYTANATSVFANHCNAELETKEWEEALVDAQKVIELDPSSYLGYKLKHAALHEAEPHDEAITVSDTTLSKLGDTSDMEIRKLRRQYVNLSEAAAAIQNVVHTRLDNAPIRLVNTFTGRLCDRGAQINAFKTSTEYKELLSSSIEDADIRMQHIVQAVVMYFSYAMLSHRWEENEPLLQDIQDKVVYDFNPVGGVVKLQAFCKTARDAGYRWAWIDTCCIDQTNNVEVQKSVNSMFVWYRNSALTIVYLLDVPPSSKSGALAKSVWNERGWTVQEFLAPKVVLFYQSDWTLYLGDCSPNHKESSAIMQELADATGIDPQALVAFRPEMKGAREKLQWASARITTLQEDMAYSLFGIFGIHLPVIYGENKQNALGRLLQEIISRSGDISALDWVGKPSEFNSCLPADITSYKALPHTLPSLSEDQIQTLISSLRKTVTVDLACKIYNLLENLRAPKFANCRLRLPCITFPVTEVIRRHARSQKVTYEVKVNGLMDLLIITEDKLLAGQTLLLVYPWNRDLLEIPNLADDMQSMQNYSMTRSLDTHERGGTRSRWRTSRLINRVRQHDSESHIRALRLIVRLRQPFRGFLLVQDGREYKRIATDHDIIAEMTSIPKIMDTRTIEIL